ncbi:carbon-nitrogen hydrolase family protein [Candidatus Latescibacterota bacterium]
MRIASAQIPMADTIDGNLATIVRFTEAAAEHHAEVILFPEMALTGLDHHLHEFWVKPDWPDQVRRGLEQLLACASATGVTMLVGAPHVTDDGCEDAVFQIDADVRIRHVGSKMLLATGERPWFVPGQDKLPTEIRGVSCGFVFCREGGMVDQLRGTGLEASDLIFWHSGGTRNHLDTEGNVATDNCRLGGVALSEAFGAPVIQSTYVTYALDQNDETRILGGSVVVSADGEILQQAPFTEEYLQVCEYGG